MLQIIQWPTICATIASQRLMYGETDTSLTLLFEGFTYSGSARTGESMMGYSAIICSSST